MRRPGKRNLLVSLVLALALAGACKKKNEAAEENARKVTVSSEDDATETIHDEDYRVELAWPGAGWKLLGEKDVKNLTPDAIAGVTKGGEITGVVIVERAPGVELEAFAQLIIDSMPLEDKVVVTLEKSEYVGEPAMEVEVTGRMREIPLRYAGRLFLHGGFAYQVLGWGVETDVKTDDFDPIFENVRLLPGEVVGRASSAETVDTVGVGWRVEDGVYESALSGLRIDPADGWRVLAGGELAQMNPDAEVGLISDSPEAYVLALVERIPGHDPGIYRKARLEAMVTNLGAEDAERSAWKTTVAGVEVEMTRLTIAGQPPLEYLHTTIMHGDLAVQILAWYMTGLRDQAQPAIARGLGAIEFLEPGPLAALSKELASLPDTQNVVGAGFSLRQGVYRDFARGFSWRTPDGFWKVSVGQAARAVNPVAQLYAEEQRRGIMTLVLAEEGASFTPRSYHEAAVASLRTELGFEGHRSAVAASIGDDQDALMSDGIVDTGDMRLYYRVITALRGSRAVQLHVWGAEGDLAESREHLAEVADNLRIDENLRVVEKRPGQYVDHRFGFAIDVPKTWVARDRTPPAMKGVGTYQTWDSSDDGIGVLALCLLEAGQDENWFMDYVEQLLRDEFTQITDDAPERAEMKVAGRTARHIYWDSRLGRLDAYLLTRDKSVFALIARSGGGSRSADQAVRDGFRFLGD